ncbi:PAS domain-containing sensor histidine kinase [Mucilaginibacter sp. OK283]|jgi:PAS domain S-box-containing protein|uniref:PAS domain-containing sensor histidine kinase n=1 Tax=Mucilaginibacter sp. OK283 TaxID=1881049 RepID=UPI0008D00AD2|nr:PAS domain-containing sensor histidine kinase [Mucilaginibacter sp. OK283]SEO58604.1 PAS domain S-box-containing protein [Mucilaginibacter sp. OK283]
MQTQESNHDNLMAFFDAMDEVFFSVDMVNMQVLQISQACEKLYGYKPADFIAANGLWFNLVHPEDNDIVVNEQKKLEQGEQASSQFRIIHKDGTTRWVEKKTIPILNPSGSLIRAEGIIRDITSVKAEKETLRLSEELYRQIVETAQEGIWTIDENEKTNFVNIKIAEILGYSAEEMMGKELYDFMDEEGKAYAIACMERRRNGAKENLNIRYVKKNGEDVWTNISANPIFDKTGRYKGALAMVTDITQSKQDQEALQKSEANLRAIFDNTDIAYVLFDDELNIVSFNAQAQKYSEERRNKTLKTGQAMKGYFPAERMAFMEEMLDKVVRNGSAEYELSYPKNDGTVEWYHIQWFVIKNSEQNPCGFVVANKNITAHKIAGLERERITADLIQQNKDLEQFTYIISHNLRAPVANIIGLSYLVDEKDGTLTEMREVLEKAAQSAKDIDTVIQDLNHILQTRKVVNEQKETVHFNNLVNDIKVNMQHIIADENVYFECAFDEASAIFSIRSFMYSIFYNIISNSIKYRRAGIVPLIHIESHQHKDKIRLTFKDNGKGIDLDKNAASLFGLYKRFDTTMEGKGMGLFMVKTQVEALGGNVKVKSKLTEGTEIILEFPFTKPGD